jgi:formamidopyrimidine-DNA glycosylase
MTGIEQLGPEPFSPEFSSDYFFERLQSTQRPIKNALLDQTIVAGIGNIYADESLFLSQIHPQTVASKLQRSHTNRLRETVIQVLQDSLDHRGTTFSTYRDARGINGNYQGHAWVYGREGQSCRICATAIQRVKLTGRSAHFCPLCQR